MTHNFSKKNITEQTTKNKIILVTVAPGWFVLLKTFEYFITH